MITATLSAKNQITIPKFILQLLRVESGDKFLVEAEKKAIKLEPIGESVVDSLIGSVKIPESKKGIPFGKALAKTKKMVAKELAAK